MITVGASENVRLSGSDGCVGNSGADDAHDVIDFSSRGPAPTGRLKPEIVGPGTHIVGTKPQHGDYTGEGVCTGTFPVGSAFYSISSGTSHSTPAIAGIAALFREWYRQNVGGGTTVPSPAMTKAVIAQSGTDLVGGNNGAGGANTSVPNQIQGWGLANIQRALAGPAQRYFRDQQDVFGATGESLTRVFTVQDTGQPVRVTLAFTDAFGPVGVNPVVNDLNLSVTGAAGTFKGNVFSDGLSATGGTADPINNLESVYLPAGTSGNFSVEVAAANIAGNGVPGNGDATDQDFALTVSNAAEVSAPILSQVSSSVTDQGDADGAIEPGENFGVTDTIRNTGNATASGISGTLAGPPMVSFPDAGAAWPDLPAGQSAANSDPLVGALDAGGICGAPVTLDLQITSTEGAGATIPVSFVTGAAGPPEARNSTNVPQAIPDDSAGGVSSTLAVAETGLIRDVNVRIGSLTHTWVGDLRLELTSPTGTTVVLANRPGGTSNGGNNFTNTVFDDEADGPIGSGAPYTGSFRPQADQLSRFDGEVQEGTWTLKVSDLAPVDTGTLSAWGHDVSPATCDFIPPPPPGGITGLTATPGPEQVALDWDQTPTATSYKVFRRNPDATTYPATPTATPAVSQLTDTGRTPGVEDCYTVRAANASGDGPMSTEVCATPLEPAPLPTPPGAVTGLVSTAGVERVSLDWDDTPGADDYYVWRLNSDGSAPALPTAIVTASQHIDTDRVAGLEQCYKLQAHNEVGTGPLSSPTCATPTAADGGGGGGGGGGVPEIPELPKLDLSGIPGTVKVNRKGRFTLRFSSTDDGMLKLTTVKAFATGRRKKVRQALASSSFTTSPTGQARMRLKLKRRHRRLLKRTRRLKVTATATAGELSAKRTFTLKAPKAKKRRRR
jgi:subtilisin-like proprotein convertase family protein